MKLNARYFLLCCLIVFLAGSMVGCAIQSGPAPNTSLSNLAMQENRSTQEVRAINDKLFSSVKCTPTLKDYVLGEGDLLQVTVFNAPDLNSEERVSERGFISLPLLGPVKVDGLTASEAEQKIESLYGAKYLRNPHVTVFVKQQVAGKITLMGAFKKTGVFPYLARQNLFQAMALGQGLTDKAGMMVQVRRQSASGRSETFLVNLDELAKGGGEQLNMEIKSGDVIYVPEAGTVYVDGAVRRPGDYPIKREMNVPQAVIAAGGFAPYADENKIELIRAGRGGKPEIARLSFKKLQGEAAGQNLEVRDGDIIFVETNKVEAVLYGLRISGLGGIVGVGYQPPSQ